MLYLSLPCKTFCECTHTCFYEALKHFSSNARRKKESILSILWLISVCIERDLCRLDSISVVVYVTHPRVQTTEHVYVIEQKNGSRVEAELRWSWQTRGRRVTGDRGGYREKTQQVSVWIISHHKNRSDRARTEVFSPHKWRPGTEEKVCWILTLRRGLLTDYCDSHTTDETHTRGGRN